MVVTTDEPRAQLMKALNSAFSNEEYSDLIIKCGTEIYKVHKVIVCSRSEFFKVACQADKFKEGIDNIVEIPASTMTTGWDDNADDSEAVKSMIHYLYHLEYSSPAPSMLINDIEESTLSDRCQSCGSRAQYRALLRCECPRVLCIICAGTYRKCRSNEIVSSIHGDYYCLSCQTTFADFKETRLQPTSSSSHLMHDAKLYAMGEKYGIPGLKALALDRFTSATKQNLSRSALAAAIRIVYNSTVQEDKGLRNVIVDLLHTQGSTLINVPEIETSIKEINGLAYDLLKKRV